MINAKRIWKYLDGYTIDYYTYSADVTGTGEELSLYEVYYKDNFLESFYTLEDAQQYVEWGDAEEDVYDRKL